MLFLILVALVWIAFDYTGMLFNPPSGLHFIRQTDSIAFVYGYSLNDLNIFRPSILNISSTDGRAACEFPLIYYLCACLYKLGISPLYSLRIIHFFLFGFGLWKVQQLLLRFKCNVLMSTMVPILLFGSTVVSYYGLNYLPDIAALGLCLAGIANLLVFFLNPSNEHRSKLVSGNLLLTFAALLKITYLFYPVVFSVVLCIGFLRGKFIVNKFWRVQIMLIALVSVVIAWWFLFVISYNQLNNSHYFMTTISPIWKLNRTDTSMILHYVLVYWRNAFFHSAVWFILALAAAYHFILNEAYSRLLFIGLVLSGLFYSLLFFEKFKDHDYYFLTIIPLLFIPLLFTTIHLSQMRFKLLPPGVITSMLVLVAAISIAYSAAKVRNRNNIKPDYFTQNVLDLEGINPLDFGIQSENTVAVFGDRTMNGSLVFLERRGMTLASSDNYIQKENSVRMEQMDYAIVLDSLCFNSFVRSTDMHYREIGRFNNHKIYEIESTQPK